MWASREPREPDGEPLESKNPAQLSTAVGFGVLYSVVLLVSAAADDQFGETMLYPVALVSGLTDIDAITLSTSRLVSDGRLDASVGWRLIIVASLSNLTFKLGIAWVLGGRKLVGRLAGVASIVALVGD